MDGWIGRQMGVNVDGLMDGAKVGGLIDRWMGGWAYRMV